MKPKGRVAVIMGGSSGIGKSIAEVLSKEGANIVIADINIAGAEKVTKKIVEHGGKCSVINADVSKSYAVEKMFKFVIKNFGHVDFLINSAGVCPVHKFEEISKKEWDFVMSVNLKALFFAQKLLFQL